jgi:hypothetical protein
VDGYCAPNQVWGYYATNWRRWPGADEEAESAAERARARTIAPPAFIVPVPAQEDADLPPKPPGSAAETSPETEETPKTDAPADETKPDEMPKPAVEPPATETPPADDAEADQAPTPSAEESSPFKDDATGQDVPTPKADEEKSSGDAPDAPKENSSGAKAMKSPKVSWSPGRAVHDLSVQTPAVRQVSAEVVVADARIEHALPTESTKSGSATGNPLRGHSLVRRDAPNVQPVIELVPVRTTAPKKLARPASTASGTMPATVETRRNPLR